MLPLYDNIDRTMLCIQKKDRTNNYVQIFFSTLSILDKNCFTPLPRSKIVLHPLPQTKIVSHHPKFEGSDHHWDDVSDLHCDDVMIFLVKHGNKINVFDKNIKEL